MFPRSVNSENGFYHFINSVSADLAPQTLTLQLKSVKRVGKKNPLLSLDQYFL